MMGAVIKTRERDANRTVQILRDSLIQRCHIGLAVITAADARLVRDNNEQIPRILELVECLRNPRQKFKLLPGADVPVVDIDHAIAI